MYATLLTTTEPAITTAARALSRSVGACWNAIARYFVCRAAIARLSQYDDRALRDIGITRSQIEAAVHGFLTVSDWSGM
jgi:uncharacterized protein YjiS (DUF1127 family)